MHALSTRGPGPAGTGQARDTGWASQQRTVTETRRSRGVHASDYITVRSRLISKISITEFICVLPVPACALWRADARAWASVRDSQQIHTYKHFR